MATVKNATSAAKPRAILKTKAGKEKSSRRFNEDKYVKILAKILPKPIKSQEDYNHFESIFEHLFDKGNKRSTEEELIFDLLTDMLEHYEKQALPPVDATTPVETLRFLMEQNDLNQTDMVEYFGSQGNVSKVLTGKRAISSNAAIKLSERFKLSTDIFLKAM